MLRLVQLSRGDGPELICNRLRVQPTCGGRRGGEGGGRFCILIGYSLKGMKEDGALTRVRLLLAGELLLQGALPAELHTPQLLLSQRRGWGARRGWGGVDQPWQAV